MLQRAVDRIRRQVEQLGDRDDALFEVFEGMAQRIIDSPALADYWRAVDSDVPAMRTARETVRDLLEVPIARAKAAGLCRADLEKTDISLISGMLGAALRGKTRDERAQLAGRALQLLRGVSRSSQRGPLMVQPYLKPVPDWEEHEKPTMPGSASMPWHPPYRRVAYALVSLLVAITGGLGNALVTANLPFLQASWR